MKKMNWKVLNLAFWLEILFAYLLPFQISDGVGYKVGFPIGFLIVYEGKDLQVNPLMSMHLNPLSLLVNVLFIYGVILCIRHVFQRMKGEREL